MLQLLFENVFYSLPLSLIEISWTTDRLQGRVSYETKTVRKKIELPFRELFDLYVWREYGATTLFKSHPSSNG